MLNIRMRKKLVDVEREGIILEQAKRNNSIIFGGKALTAQLYPPLARSTFDFDILANSPQRSARELERTLDKRVGADVFYVKPALHPGTFKVMDSGHDLKKGTKDDFGIADYSKKKPGVKTKLINGIMFVDLSEVKKDKLKSLRDPESSFRHAKDQKDLDAINISNKIDNVLNPRFFKPKFMDF